MNVKDEGVLGQKKVTKKCQENYKIRCLSMFTVFIDHIGLMDGSSLS